jgi:hypothetical protein
MMHVHAARGTLCAACHANGNMPSACYLRAELEHGKKMQLSWRRGEDAQAVAARFISENGLAAVHTQDIVNFVLQAEQRPAAASLPSFPLRAARECVHARAHQTARSPPRPLSADRL